MSRFMAGKYASLEEYVPGEQPRDKKYIKLNTNESPYPPSQEVIDAVNAAEVADLRLYSDPNATELTEVMAEAYGTGKDNVYLANGSDDILNFCFMAYGESGVAFPEISYGFYEVFAQLSRVKCDKIPLRRDFTIDENDYCGIGKTVVIANPNAPTGICLSLGQIEKIVRSNPNNVVVIDEAYVDFGGQSAVSLIKKYGNLIVVGTFSKSRSLAGARLGFAFADKSLISDLQKLKYSTNPYNINRLTLVAGCAAIRSQKYFDDNVKEIIRTREYTKSELKKLGFTVTDSKANFLFVESDRVRGEQLYKKLKDRGILIRHFSTEAIKNYNRITIGTRDEMETLISQIKEIIKECAK